MWTPSSPDINPIHFAIWSILEPDVSTRYHHNLDSLKAVIQSISLDQVCQKICVTFLHFSESASQTHYQNIRRSFINLYFEKSSEKFLEAFFHILSGFIFIGVFRWVNHSGPPCIPVSVG